MQKYLFLIIIFFNYASYAQIQREYEIRPNNTLYKDSIYIIKALELPQTPYEEMTLSIKWTLEGNYEKYNSDKSGTRDSIFLDKLRLRRRYGPNRHNYSLQLDVEFNCSGQFRYKQRNHTSDWVSNNTFAPFNKVSQIICDKNEYLLTDSLGNSLEDLKFGFYHISDTGKMKYHNLSKRIENIEETPFIIKEDIANYKIDSTYLEIELTEEARRKYYKKFEYNSPNYFAVIVDNELKRIVQFSHQPFQTKLILGHYKADYFKEGNFIKDFTKSLE